MTELYTEVIMELLVKDDYYMGIFLKTQIIQCKDVNIAYTENGEGNVMLLLHGNSENKEIFKKYQTEYFRDFHTFALDSRAHGQSSWNGENLSIEQMSNDVIEFCRLKNIPKASVIGFSDGGNIALFLAKNAPDLFTDVIALSPNTLVSGTEKKTLTLINAFQKVYRFLKKIGINTDKWIKRFNLMLTDIGLSFKDLSSIRTRVHIIYSEHDMINEDHILQIHKAIQGSTIYKEMKANHMNEVGKTGVVNRIRSLLA